MASRRPRPENLARRLQCSWHRLEPSWKNPKPHNLHSQGAPVSRRRWHPRHRHPVPGCLIRPNSIAHVRLYAPRNRPAAISPSSYTFTAATSSSSASLPLSSTSSAMRSPLSSLMSSSPSSTSSPRRTGFPLPTMMPSPPLPRYAIKPYVSESGTLGWICGLLPGLPPRQQLRGQHRLPRGPPGPGLRRPAPQDPRNHAKSGLLWRGRQDHVGDPDRCQRLVRPTVCHRHSLDPHPTSKHELGPRVQQPISGGTYLGRVFRLPKVYVKSDYGDPMVDRFVQLAQFLQSCGVPVYYRFNPGGSHGIELTNQTAGQELYGDIKWFVNDVRAGIEKPLGINFNSISGHASQ